MTTSRAKQLVVLSSLAAVGALGACDEGSDPAPAQGQAVTAKGGTAGAGGSATGGSATSGGAGKSDGTAGVGGSGTSTAGAGGTELGSAGAGAAAGSGAGGTDGDAPAPSCAKGGFYDFSSKALGGAETVSMCAYAGQVVMVVNVASKCGYTPQYKPLQALYAKYQAQGFVVLGFPSADFGNQEFADDKDISEFCTGTYGISFPMFSRIDVKGPNQDPLYAWLTKQPGGEGEITWNFNKFLLGRDGVFRQRFATETSPDSAVIADAVEAALTAP